MKNTKVKAILSTILALSIASAMAMPAFAATAPTDANGSGAIVWNKGTGGTLPPVIDPLDPGDPSNPLDPPTLPPIVPPGVDPNKYNKFMSWNTFDFGTQELSGSTLTYNEVNSAFVGVVVNNGAQDTFTLKVALSAFDNSGVTMQGAYLDLVTKDTTVSDTNAGKTAAVSVSPVKVLSAASAIQVMTGQSYLAGANWTPTLTVVGGTAKAGLSKATLTWDYSAV